MSSPSDVSSFEVKLILKPSWVHVPNLSEQFCSSNGNQVMSILHVDWNATCSKQVETQFYELHSTRSVRWFCQRKENLKDPRRQIWTKARVRDNDIGRERPVKLFICAEKKRKFFLNWLLKIFWVRKWDLLYISISGFQIMSAGSLQRMSWFQSLSIPSLRLYRFYFESFNFK